MSRILRPFVLALLLVVAAAMVALHETKEGSGGMMEMSPVAAIDVPAGGSVAA
jgi:copper(I)-binding protein